MKRGICASRHICDLGKVTSPLPGWDSARHWLFCGACPKRTRGHVPFIVGNLRGCQKKSGLKNLPPSIAIIGHGYAHACINMHSDDVLSSADPVGLGAQSDLVGAPDSVGTKAALAAPIGGYARGCHPAGRSRSAISVRGGCAGAPPPRTSATECLAQ